MFGKKRRISDRSLFLGLMCAAVVLFFLPSSITGRLQFCFAGFFRHPLMMSRNIPFFGSGPQAAEAAAEQSGVCEQEFVEMRNYLENVTRQLAQEKQKVRKLAGIRDRGSLEAASLLIGNVITASLEGSKNELVIDRGRNDGLRQGQYVLADHSIIGIVEQVRANTARVALLSDTDVNISVTVGQADAERVMRGMGGGKSSVLLMSTKYEVEQGDPVFASPRAGYLEAPVIAGLVSRVARNADNPLIWDIEVEPACSLADVSTVVVVVME